MENPRDLPTAGDYAQDSAASAHKRIDQLEERLLRLAVLVERLVIIMKQKDLT